MSAPSRSVPGTAAAAAAVVVLALSLVPHGARADLAGHGGPVRGIAVSPDGAAVLTASFDYSLMLWTLRTQTERLRLLGHDAGANAVAFVPEGRRAVSGGDDGVVGFWDLEQGTLLHRFEGHEGKVAGVAVSPDGRFAASASWDHTVRLWDLDRREPAGVLRGHEGNVNAVAFLPDGRHVVAAGYDGTLRLWSMDGAGNGDEPVRTLTGHGLPVNALAVAGTGLVVSAGTDETVRLWDVLAGKETRVLYGHVGPVFALAAAADGGMIASGGADGRVRLWRRGDGEWQRFDIRHDGPVWALAFSPDGGRLVSAGIDDVARVWDTATGKPVGATAQGGSAALPAGMPDAGGRGARLFARCRACHTLTPDDGRRAGPTLYGLFGRVAGELGDYAYSDALERSGIVWTEETVDALFREGPHLVVPGSKMPLQRIPDAGERRALIDYLVRATRPD
ncbi:MAG TPA: hypothetical protein VK943_10115 [Arenibaculum sp.]|nr:hypothetical protein [Arenibaculum sp.]